MNELTTFIRDNTHNIISSWKHLHETPEMAFHEYQTSTWLGGTLAAEGYEVKNSIGGTGVIGLYDTGISGADVCIRAEMDALQFEIDGKNTCIHACGHDANCTAALWAGIALKRCGAIKSGKLKILFQPAEESLGGADAIIKSGELENTEYLIGVHLRPKEELPLGKIAPTVLHGASGSIKVTVHGENAHGARPQQGINAIEAASLIISSVQALHMDPTIPHSIKPTQIFSGNTPFNIIPDLATIVFDLRAQTNEMMECLKKNLETTASYAAACIGANVDCEWNGGVPAATRFDDLTKKIGQSICRALGEDFLADVIYTSGGEDFHKYAIAYPGLQAAIIGIGANLTPGLHKPNMHFDTAAIIFAATVLATIASDISNHDDTNRN